MSKFKVGDRVKWNGMGEDLVDHWMRYWATKGDDRPSFFYVTGITNGGKDITYSTVSSGHGPLCPVQYFELAPKFAVGDKVRALIGWIDVTKGNLYGVTEVDDEDGGVYVWDDVGDKGYMYGYEVELIQSAPTYTSCAAAEVDNLADEYGGGRRLKIVAGRFYKTRDGRKVGPMAPDGGHYMWTTIDGRTRSFNLHGGKHPVEHNLDLIAEWSEPVVAPATTAKFKVGDRVRVKLTGNEYTITAKRVSWMLGRTVYDAAGDGKGGGAFFAEHLELITPTTMADIVRKHSGTAVVMLIENGQPKPATRPYVHGDRAAATTEAERLAATMPGSEFGVYELMTRRVADVVVREVA